MCVRWRASGKVRSCGCSTSGVYRGTGVWTIAAGEGNCRVTYRVDLEIVDPLMKILSYIMSIPRLHSSLMREVFAGLAGYLAQNKK